MTRRAFGPSHSLPGWPFISDYSINYLEVFFTSYPRCNRKVLLPLYQFLVRSILDYGSSIYGLAPSSQLALLDTTQNVAFRITTGTLCTKTGFLDSTTAPSIIRQFTFIYCTAFPNYLFNKIWSKPKSQGGNAHIPSHLNQSLSHIYPAHLLGYSPLYT